MNSAHSIWLGIAFCLAGDQPSAPVAGVKANFAENWSAKDLRAIPYSTRVAAAVVTFIELYSYMHEKHDTPAKDMGEEQRTERAAHAVKLALDLQRAIIALAGTHRRRAYAHDLVYGMHQLYHLFGKPWNAATEGNEHAHGDMKKFFHDLVTHSKGSDCLACLKLFTVKQQVMRTVAPKRLWGGKYGAARAGAALKTVTKGKEVVVGMKAEGGNYKGEGKMLANARSLSTEFETNK